jgi:hypothetical protein
MVDFNIDGS